MPQYPETTDRPHQHGDKPDGFSTIFMSIWRRMALDRYVNNPQCIHELISDMYFY